MTPEEFEKSNDATEKAVVKAPDQIDLAGKLSRPALYAMGIDKKTSAKIMQLHANTVRTIRDHSRREKREQLVEAIEALLPMLNFDQLQKAFLKIFYLYKNDQPDPSTGTPTQEDTP